MLNDEKIPRPAQSLPSSEPLTVQQLADNVDRLTLQLARMQQRSRTGWRVVFTAGAVVVGFRLLQTLWLLVLAVRNYFAAVKMYENWSMGSAPRFWPTGSPLAAQLLLALLLLGLCLYGLWKMRTK